VFDERLTCSASSFYHVHDIVNDEILYPRDDVRVIQPEIGVANDYPFALQRERHAEIDGDGRFAYSTFTRSYDDFPCHSKNSFQSNFRDGNYTIKVFALTCQKTANCKYFCQNEFITVFSI
jgi:hypothetical protein